MLHQIHQIVFFDNESSNSIFFQEPRGDSPSLIRTEFATIEWLNVQRKDDMQSVHVFRVTSNSAFEGTFRSFDCRINVLHNWTLDKYKDQQNYQMIHIMSDQLTENRRNSAESSKYPILLIDELGGVLCSQLAVILTILRLKNETDRVRSLEEFNLANYLQLVSVHRPGCLGNKDEFRKIVESIFFTVDSNFQS